MVAGIPFTAADYFYYRHRLGVQAYYPLYLLLMAMLLWIAAKAHLRPETAAAADMMPVLKPSIPVELKQKSAWLKKIIKENRYYEDPDLSLSSLAEKLGISLHELSRVINTVLKKSFNDFINEYRIADVIQKMQ